MKVKPYAMEKKETQRNITREKNGETEREKM